MRFRIRFWIVLCFSGVSLVTGQTAKWSWYFHAVDVPKTNPGYVDLVLGIRTESPDKPGRLGNFNVRGTFSDGLFDLNSENPPEIVAVTYDSVLTRLSLPHTGAGWQLNAVYTGNFEAGPAFDQQGRALMTLRFFIRDTSKSSGFDLIPLSQTYWDDNLTAVNPGFDSSEGNIHLWATSIEDTTDTTGIKDVALPTRFALHQNFPNPFNLATQIRYELPKASTVTLQILNMAGQTIRRFDYGRQFAGHYVVLWDGRNDQGRVLTSGLYILQFRAGNYQNVRKMLLAK